MLIGYYPIQETVKGTTVAYVNGRYAGAKWWRRAGRRGREPAVSRQRASTLL